jgi:acyl-CoA reductase-like NAD-dependent aldehyde dehydrogenase
MNSKILILGASLAIITGSAIAGSSTGTSALDDPAKMSPFFTDAGMKTMKSEADAKAAWTAMSADDRAAVMKECADEAVAKSHADFCNMAMAMGK